MPKRPPPSFQVNSRQCSTCIFGQQSIISPQRFAELKQDWADNNQVQICHHSKRNVGCRGHYEAARQNDIPHPISAIAAKHFGISNMSVADLMQIFERIGYITFIRVEEDPPET